MLAKNKTIYFILGDTSAPTLPEIPDSDLAKRTLLQAYILLFKEIVRDHAGDFGSYTIDELTDNVIKELSDYTLREISLIISDRIKNDPELIEKNLQINDYERIAIKWKELAIQSGSPDAQSVANYVDAVVAQKQEAVNILRQSKVDSSGLMRSAKLLGFGAGNMLLALDIAGALQDASTDPEGALSSFVGIAVGAVVGSLVMTAIVGTAGLLSLPLAGVAATVAVTITAGYVAGKIGEYIWDEFISDDFWGAIDRLGYGDGVRRVASWVGQKVGAVVPGDPEHPPYIVERESSGVVIASNEKSNIVVGNEFSNEIVFLHGRTVAHGAGGNDIYRVHTTAKGNQVISDSEGSNSLIFGIENIEHLEFQKVGENVYKSTGGSYTIIRVVKGSGSDIVVKSDYYADVVILDWNVGDFGISLPDVVAPQPVPAGTLTAADDLFGEFGTNGGNDVITALAGNDGLDGGNGDDTLDGGAGNDLILGGAGNDRIFGGDGDDHIFDGSERANLREWTSTERDQADYDIQNYLGTGTLLARGASWYVVQGGPLDGAHAPQWILQDPDLHPSGDDIIDAGAGNDRVFAGEGNDIVLGGSGDDYLNGGHDDDTIHGGDGNDDLSGRSYGVAAPIEDIHADARAINHSRVSDIVGTAGLRFGDRSFPRRRKSLFLSGDKSDSRLCRHEGCKRVCVNGRHLQAPLSAGALLLACALLLTACGNRESPKPPNVELNEHPVDAYVATLEVEGLDQVYTVTATGHFTIENRRSCQPIDKRRSLGGSFHYYYESQVIPVIKVAENVYKLTFYTDYFKSVDYYGLGECRWTGHPTFEILTSEATYNLDVGDERQRVERVCLSHTMNTRNADGEVVPSACSIIEPSAVPESRKSFTATTTYNKE